MKYVDDTVEGKTLAERDRIREEVRQELMRDMGFTPNPASAQLGGIASSATVAELSGITKAKVDPKILAILKNLPKATG